MPTFSSPGVSELRVNFQKNTRWISRVKGKEWMGGRLTRLDSVFDPSCLDICVFSNRLDGPSAVRQTHVKTFFFAGLFVMTKNYCQATFSTGRNISLHNSQKNNSHCTFCSTMADTLLTNSIEPRRKNRFTF